tara:strand:+ start:3893 stop:4162 length:270 start_codon:yes stop_codon:yes gene_type:complete
MTFLLILISNLILYAVLRIHLVKKFRNTYSIYLKDSEGNRQTLSDTIAYILEQRDILDQKVMYVAGEMEKQWLEIEKVKMVTGTDKFDT